MRRFFQSRASPLVLGGALAMLLGILAGLGTFTLGYARGTSYLSDDPAACVNCHIMREQFAGWETSSHREVAVCNDCHMPHNNIVNKWFTKALNGFNHSFAFTTGDFPENIKIKARNADIVQANCIGCHQTLVSQVYGQHADQERKCYECHEAVAGH